MPILFHKRARRIFGRSTAELLRAPPRPVAWQLEVREDANDRGMFLPDATCHGHLGHSVRLASYISAGGLRDLRPGRHAESDARRRLLILRFALGLLIFWLIFFFVPCR